MMIYLSMYLSQYVYNWICKIVNLLCTTFVFKTLNSLTDDAINIRNIYVRSCLIT